MVYHLTPRDMVLRALFNKVDVETEREIVETFDKNVTAHINHEMDRKQIATSCLQSVIIAQEHMKLGEISTIWGMDIDEFRNDTNIKSKTFAKLAVRHADALIAELDKPVEQENTK